MKKTFNAEKSENRISGTLEKFLKTLPAFLLENSSDLDEIDKEEIMEFLNRAVEEEKLFMQNNPANYFDLYYRDKHYKYDKSQDRKTTFVIDAKRIYDKNDVFSNVKYV